MKKIVAAALLSLCILCGCSKTREGTDGELTRYSWSAETDGGGELRLIFDGDKACLSLKNGEKSAEIKGRYLADESELVIFDEELGQNYGFGYVPNGEKLELSFEDNSIELSAEKK